MPENPLMQARFDHVDDTGRLVFSAGEQRFCVIVDETLERALLEAKQIREESRSAPSSTTSATLPISQIQALIRAGADPARVAERYHLSEALVRRFSSAVEMEKQYAIEQFFTVPAPKESRGRTLADVIERTLAVAGIGMESVTWKATRRGLEPWRITASFESAGRQARAEWSWNMHDNAVVCLNPTAKKLLGAASGPREGAAAAADAGDFAAAVSLPGDSVRSARIERAVSAWNTPKPTLPAARPEARLPRETSPLDAPEPASASQPSGGDIPRTGALPLAAQSGTAVAPASSSATGMSATGQPAAAAGSTAAAGETPRTQTAESAQADAKPAKRRSGRSAVPSWDEILFGE
ncbi:septation protein SepH [Bifidobacterium leontopitheci]|uniref:DUF3071 domain-containing protein n=1 Tax=Bifidobacterium leontopitheci TaxID=2650774 RepID=A0A6I1GPJ8_9BIFI|nr:septation protein SepH [Bifidobacterium leontopitheci]KAB7791207.1 hypothetical protein F7D09_0373 [Bifidobacterium leontopitheci]